jgi:hypothetical protein
MSQKSKKCRVFQFESAETAQLKVRSNYAYSSEGYRKRNGDVMVPLFATLQFELKLN